MVDTSNKVGDKTYKDTMRDILVQSVMQEDGKMMDVPHEGAMSLCEDILLIMETWDQIIMQCWEDQAMCKKIDRMMMMLIGGLRANPVFAQFEAPITTALLGDITRSINARDYHAMGENQKAYACKQHSLDSLSAVAMVIGGPTAMMNMGLVSSAMGSHMGDAFL